LDHQNRPVGLAVSGIERPVPFPADNTPPSLAKFRKQLEEKVTQAMTKAIEGQPYNYSEEYFPRRAPSHPLEKIPPQILGPKR